MRQYNTADISIIIKHFICLIDDMNVIQIFHLYKSEIERIIN